MLTDLYQQKKRCALNGGFLTEVNIAAAGVTQDIKVPKASTLISRFQRIRVVVLTGSAGKTWQFRAKTTTTTVLTTTLDMSTAGVVHLVDHGPKGMAIPVGETLEVSISAAGAAARVEVDGYYA